MILIELQRVASFHLSSFSTAAFECVTSSHLSNKQKSILMLHIGALVLIPPMSILSNIKNFISRLIIWNVSIFLHPRSQIYFTPLIIVQDFAHENPTHVDRTSSNQKHKCCIQMLMRCRTGSHCFPIITLMR